MNIKLGAWYTSSVDPAKIGTMVKGAMIGLASVALFAAQLIDIPLTQAEWIEISTELSAAISGILIAYGFVQKMFVKFFVKK